MASNSLISIIIPVYNADKYLSHCIQCIVSQTLTDFELILVNDGSIDNSLNLCESFAQNDTRIKVFSHKNSGVSKTRNVGLDAAKGRYITFIDADDWIDMDYLEILVNNSPKSDFVVGGHIEEYIDQNKSISEKYDSFYTNECHKLNKYIQENNFLLKCHPWGKLLNREIIENNNIRFNEKLTIGEDFIFVYNYLLACNSFCFIPYEKYHYRINTSPSLSSSLRKYSEYDIFFNILTDIYPKLYSKFGIADINYIEDIYNKFMLPLKVSSIYSLYVKKEYSRKSRISILSDILKKFSEQIDKNIKIKGKKIKLMLVLWKYKIPIPAIDFILSLI